MPFIEGMKLMAALISDKAVGVKSVIDRKKDASQNK